MKIKSLFISLYITAMSLALAQAAWMLHADPRLLPWWAVVIAIAPGLLFFAKLFLAPTARTAAVMWSVFGFNALGTLLLWVSGSLAVWPWVHVLGLGWGGNALYQFWYSRFGRQPSPTLTVGKKLPTLQFEDAKGKAVNTDDIPGAVLLMFYRGNWCPLCMAQIKEVAQQYQALAARGVQTLLISSQPHDNTADLAAKFNVPFHFLVDKDNRVASALQILAKDGTPTGLQVLGYGNDTVMPTVVLTDRHKTIVFCDETDNYRVRPEPATFLALLDAQQR
ncbi:MAG: redoxin domain-containing protein [Aquabacterium sp.]|nr:redoxin domain-containing protein [Aquabacterium sp.]